MRRYFGNLGLGLDEFLNTVFGGLPDQTISRRAALARQAGRRWGCLLCWWLDRTVERNHCVLQLGGLSEKPAAALRAAAQLLALAAALVGAAHLPGLIAARLL